MLGSTMGDRWRLYGSLIFILTYSSIEATLPPLSDGNNFHITVSGNNSMRPYADIFQVNMTIYNKGAHAVKNIRMKNIHSSNVVILSSSIISKDGKLPMITAADGVQYVASGLYSKDSLIITFEIRVGDGLAGTDTGYHIENLLVHLYNKNDQDEVDTVQNTFIPLPYIKPGCDMRFDVDRNGVPGEILNTSVTASSYYDTSKPSDFGEYRLGWCAKDNTQGQYLQILFKRRVRLTFIGIGGRREKQGWVKQYRLKFKLGDRWYDYNENGFPRKFKGSKYLDESFGWMLVKLHCDGLQIIPVEWNGQLICLRAIINGCYISDHETCTRPLGMQSGLIPDKLLSDSGIAGISPTNARFGKDVTVYPYGWQARSGKPDWLQVDMLALYRITRVAVQGAAGGLSFYVKTLRLEYSNDTYTWTKFGEILHGPTTDYEARDGKIIDLKYGIVGRSFRLTPVEFWVFKVMRIELFGCVATWLKPELIEENIYSHSTRSVLVDKKGGRIFLCQDNSVLSSCFYSDETDSFNVWRKLPVHISKMVAVEIESGGSWYARTRRGAITFIQSTATGKWFDISNYEYERRIKNKIFVTPISLPSRMSKNPEVSYRWMTSKNHDISVTESGVHVRGLNGDWQLKARWTCCGF